MRSNNAAAAFPGGSLSSTIPIYRVIPNGVGF